MTRFSSIARPARSLSRLLALALCAILLALAPFAAALEVHHELAAADHDDHQHSDTDLCQWVQHHTGSSLSLAPPALSATPVVERLDWPTIAELVTAQLFPDGPSRAPPQL